MTADLIALPGYCLKVVHLLSGEARMDRLRKLAESADCMDAALVTDALERYARDDMSAAERDIAWSGYLAALSEFEDVRDGLLGWEAICDELTCSDRQEVAAGIAEQNAEDALALLAGVKTNGGFSDGA